MDIVDFLLNDIPSKSYFYLIYLLIITFFSFFLIFYFSKKAKKTKNFNKSKKLTLEDLLKIAKNSKSNTKDLLFALVYFSETFKVKQNKDKSIKLFKLILNHKNRNKSLFDFFHGNILPANLEFKDELDKLEREALNREG